VTATSTRIRFRPLVGLGRIWPDEAEPLSASNFKGAELPPKPIIMVIIVISPPLRSPTRGQTSRLATSYDDDGLDMAADGAEKCLTLAWKVSNIFGRERGVRSSCSMRHRPSLTPQVSFGKELVEPISTL
jgi:hypothetical protein